MGEAGKTRTQRLLCVPLHTWRAGFEHHELVLKHRAQLSDKASRLPQHLFGFVFVLCVRGLLKPPEPIALSQHVEKRNEMVPEFVYPFFILRSSPYNLTNNTIKC